MKKQILSIATFTTIALNAFGQITVLDNGQTHIGNMPSRLQNNSIASLHVWDIKNNGGGLISFGEKDSALIGGSGDFGGYLTLKADNGIAIGVDNRSILHYTKGMQVITLGYPVQAASFLTSSDSRLKTNVTSIEDLYLQLHDINPISYNLTYPVQKDVSFTESDSAKTEFIKDDRIRYGFLAQEVREILPDLVVEGEDGYLSIDYIGFIPILVDAYKNLSAKVEEQSELIAELLGNPMPQLKPSSVQSMNDDKLILKQNRPNPFNSTTMIECEVPENIGTAFICIYNLQGNQVKHIDLQERGSISVKIEASSLTPGMYIYSLIADGNEVDSKRMIITD